MRLHYAKTRKEDIFLLSDDEFRHSIKVLRQKTGDPIQIFDGSGYIYYCKIVAVTKSHLEAQIKTSEKRPQKNYHLTIAIAPTKNPSRYEWFVEKAVEIGVDKIIPIITHRSEKSRIKKERLHKIVVSAMKQSKNIIEPILEDPIVLTEVLQEIDASTKFVAYVEEEEILLSSQELSDTICILIGPEGGFTEAEINIALEHDFKPVSLGFSRLRTETAGMAACQIIKTLREIK